MLLELRNSACLAKIDKKVFHSYYEHRNRLGDTITVSPSELNWYLNHSTGYVYAVKVQDNIQFSIVLHRLITPKVPGCMTDHRNQDKLDNRLRNLRPVSRSQNLYNRKKITKLGTSSKYKGVCFVDNRFLATIYHKNKRITLGRFIDELSAAKAYDAGLREVDPTTPKCAFNF